MNKYSYDDFKDGLIKGLSLALSTLVDRAESYDKDTFQRRLLRTPIRDIRGFIDSSRSLSSSKLYHVFKENF